tara:strand:+ start:476 stop:859 length:384 start_codon:yes stop_codon:yes gene_type:complete
MKKQLLEAEIDFVERDSKEHTEEWEVVKSMTAVPVFPTLVVDGEFLIPNRDFQNVKQGVEMVKRHMSDEYIKADTDNMTRELLKTINASINIVAQRMATLQQKVDKVETTLSDLIVNEPEEVTDANS